MSDFIVSGSRRITNYQIVAQAMDDAITKFGVCPTLIIEGGQRSYVGQKIVGGVDWLARLWALKHDVLCKTINAEWSQGKKAGPLRNRQMAREGKHLVAIPDAESRGTVDMIEAARQAGLGVYVHYDPDLFPEGPTGCLVDGDALSVALRQLARDNGGQKCDLTSGPCSCGGWH